ncbi:MAG: hypothetical protein JXD23_16540 [Spirochaetales bacterium]|nr:hypothetical protein [Spirochaetales bacterium]
MTNEENEFVKEMLFYQYSNGLPVDEGFAKKITTEYSLDSDCPIVFFGILYDLYYDPEFKYFNRNVSNEIYAQLLDLYKSDQTCFYNGFKDGFASLALALQFYMLAKEKKNELSYVTFEEDTKSTIYRIPMFIIVCENVLMNFYRFISCILSKISGNDYQSQNTLGQILPVMQKYGFNLASSVNKFIRNSINHGMVYYFNTEIEFEYIDSGNKKKERFYVGDFDSLIDEYYDIASGIIIGIIRLLSANPIIIFKEFEYLFQSKNRDNWFKILYHSKNIRCIDVDTTKCSGQVNLHIKTEIMDENKLQIALKMLLSGLYQFYPEQNQYFVGYKHPRSNSGFIRMPKEDLEAFLKYKNGELPKFSGEQLYVLYPIRPESIDIKRYNYFVFPEIRGDDWYLEKAEIVSTKDFKRIKGRLILKQRFDKEQINSIVDKIITEVKDIEIPENPKSDVKTGKDEIDALFITVFIEPPDRKSFSLFSSNDAFVCIANYYKDENIIRLKHGGVPVGLWKSYKKNTKNKVEYAWNANYKPVYK